MKRLLITLSAIGCLLLADPDVTGNWKLSGLKVDYIHISRETVPVVLHDSYGSGIVVPVSEVPEGAIFQRFTNGPFTLPIIDAVQLNLNVNLYPDGTGYIAEGSFYPDIDLIDGTCITSPQIFPVTDEFVWELGGEGTFAPVNIVGVEGLNDLAGSGAWGFGVAESGTFDGWPSTPLAERIPSGLPYLALDAENILAYACDTAIIGSACAGLGIDATADLNGCIGALMGAGLYVGDGSGAVEQQIGQCFASDYETALTYFGGAGWLHGSGSSGFIALDQGNSQMGQDLNVDLMLEWNAIDGATSGSGLVDDATVDEDGDGTEYDRTFGIPYIPATYVDQSNPLCDITGGALTGTGPGLNYPVAGDIVDVLGGEAAAGALVTGSCIEGTTALCEAAGGASEVVYAGCMAGVVPTVEGLCDAAGSPQAAVAGLCFETSQDPSLLATCEYAGVDATVVGACMQLGFAAEDCAAAGGIAGRIMSKIPGISGMGGLLVGAIAGETIQRGAEAAFSVKQNPYMEMMFSGIGFRSFKFDFVFRARNKSEINMVGKIIQMFRQHSRPSWQGGALGKAFMKYPQEYKIQFLTDTNGTYLDNLHLPQLKPCVCSNVETNFTPDNIWSAYEGGAPVSITLGLTFQEKELVMADDIAKEWPSLTAPEGRSEDFGSDEFGMAIRTARDSMPTGSNQQE